MAFSIVLKQVSKSVWMIVLLAHSLAAPATAADPSTSTKEKPPSRTDLYGDPLPPGALARIGTVRLRHGDSIRCLAFSPDGKTLASASEDGTFRRWDVATGKELWRFEESMAGAIAYSPDGKTLATGSSRRIRLWDIASGQEQPRIAPNMARSSPVFSSDGKVLAADTSRGIRLFDTITGRDIRPPLQGDRLRRSLSLSFLSISRDGKTLVSAGADNTIRVWNLTTGEEQFRLKGHTNEVNSVVQSPDGKVLVSGGEDKTIRLWDMATGKALQSMEQPGRVDSVAFSSNGKSLIVSGNNQWDFAPTASPKLGLLQVWEISPEFKLRRSIALRYGGPKVALAPDDRTVAVSQYHTIRLLDIVSGKETRLDEEPDGDIDSLAVSSDTRTAAAAEFYGPIRLFDITTGQVIRRFALDVETPVVHDIAFSREGKKLASAGVFFGEKTLLPIGFALWDIPSGKKARIAPNELDYSLAFSPDGKTLATGSRTIKLRDAATGKELRRLTSEQDDSTLSPLGFCADGTYLAEFRSGKVVLWDVASGREICTLALGDRKFRRIMAVSPAGGLLATESFTTKERSTVHLWDVTEGTERYRIRLSNGVGYIPPLAFSPDGRTLAIGYTTQLGDAERRYFEHRVQVWEVATGQLRREWKGHSGRCSAVAFSPDGKRLLSSSADTTVLVWDVLARPTTKASGPLSSQDQQALWTELASKDALKAFDAICRLSASPQEAVAMLQMRIRPVSALADPKQITRLIADLDSDDFAVREKAMDQLRHFDERVVPSLRQALQQKPSPESRKRMEELLAGMSPLADSPDRLRELRGVEVLEHIGTTDAKGVLKMLSEGDANARLTREAKASLARLGKRHLPHR